MGTVPTSIQTEIEIQYTIPIHSILETLGRGDVTYDYTYGDRDTIYHHYILSFSGYQAIHTGTVTGGVYIQIYMYIIIYI